MARTKEESAAYMREWRRANLEKAKAISRRSNIKRYYANPTKANAERLARDHEKPHLKHRRMKRYYETNSGTILARGRRIWLNRKLEALIAFGGHCVCCNENTVEFLTFDHINGDGGKDRKAGLKGGKWYKYLVDNVDSGAYQVLCYNCHMAKDYFGGCIHGRA